MEGSNSETPQNRANYGNVDNEDIIMSFGSFGLHDDGNTRFQASSSNSNNGFRIASSQTPRENNSNDRLSTNLVPDHSNIWANHDFTTRGSHKYINIRERERERGIFSVHSRFKGLNFTLRFFAGEKLVEDLQSGPENFAGGSNRILSINTLAGFHLPQILSTEDQY